MKQDMELIKLMLQTLTDNENYYMLLDAFAKQMQEKTKTQEPFNDKLVGHFFLAKDAGFTLLNFIKQNISTCSQSFFTMQIP